MERKYENFAFAGGGILGIAYLGMLDYLYEINFIQNINQVAGTSAGAITACITAFNLPFEEVKTIVDSLEYSKVLSTDVPSFFTKSAKRRLDKAFGNIDCVYRLIQNYGWYSSKYFYEWMKIQIANQFDSEKKSHPYTFADFMDPSLHKEERSFKKLYIIGTDVSKQTSSVFSFDSTPNMEVAEAIRISMSIPLLFEAVKAPIIDSQNTPIVYTDGGVMYNYPINLFDKEDCPSLTLGSFFRSSAPPIPIHNLVDFISNLLSCASSIQLALYQNNPENINRSIIIPTGDISSMDFQIETGDETYNFLYEQGYKSAQIYFATH